MKRYDGIRNYWKAYEGDKCSLATMYRKVKDGMSFEEAVKATPIEERYGRGKSKEGRFADIMKRYVEQPQPKAERTVFYNRIVRGRDKQEALYIELPLKEKKKPTANKNPYFKPKPRKVIKQIDDYYSIRFTYKEAEAKIFYNEYKRMLTDLETKLGDTDDAIEIADLRIKIEQIQKEIQIFIQYNPICAIN